MSMKPVKKSKNLTNKLIALAKKANGKLTFIGKLADRKGISYVDAWCSLGAEQKVEEVIPAAGGCFYKASYCTGCGRRSTSKECPIMSTHYMFNNRVLEVDEIITRQSPINEIKDKSNKIIASRMFSNNS